MSVVLPNVLLPQVYGLLFLKPFRRHPDVVHPDVVQLEDDAPAAASARAQITRLYTHAQTQKHPDGAPRLALALSCCHL